MATKLWVNIGSGNSLLPDGTKPLHEPMLTYHVTVMAASGCAWNLQRKLLWILSTISNQKRNYTGTMYTMNDSGTPKRRRNNTEGYMTPVMDELLPPHWLPGPMPPPNGRYPIPPPLQTHQPLPYAQVANNAQASGMTDSDKLNFLIEKKCVISKI